MFESREPSLAAFSLYDSRNDFGFQVFNCGVSFSHARYFGHCDVVAGVWSGNRLPIQQRSPLSRTDQ